MNSTPPLSDGNRFACLSVDVIDTDDTPETIVVPTPKSPPKPTPLKRWERRLPRTYTISAILPTTPHSKSLDLDVEVETLDSGIPLRSSALLDSGAEGLFLDAEWVHSNNITTKQLRTPIPVFNVDGTPNEAGMITEVADLLLRHKGHTERALFAITKLGPQTMILGFSWLEKHNPEVNWQTRTVQMSRCPESCRTCRATLRAERQDKKQTAEHIQACRSGPFPVLVEDCEEEEDEGDDPSASSSDSAPFGTGDDMPTFSDDVEPDNYEPGDRIFATWLHPEPTPTHVRATTSVSARLAEAHARNSDKMSFRDLVPEMLHEFEDVFSKESFDALPERRQWDHAIELNTDDPHLPRSKVYPMSLDEQAELDSFLDEALQTGRIRPSKSPIGAPVFFIKKKDGGLRFIQDYRALNEITIKNGYPLPLIDDLIHRLRGAHYFTKLDVRWGYNNVRIREGDEWKAAFRTNRGLFEPLVMYFGLTNSPATFQTMMNDLFHDLIMEGHVCIYLDDILIFTSDLETHRDVVRRVMEVLRANKLYLRAEKCEFEKTRIEYLGVIISHNHVEMDPVKVAGVAEWPTPKSRKEVQSFLGFTNFYRRFILNFSDDARPLFDLSKKDVTFRWGISEEEAFTKLKKSITSAPTLTLPSDNQPFRVEADGSGVATGAVLSQLSSEDGKWHPVSFLSKSLSAVERNYEIHDVEMLAVMRALEEWRHYLEGARQPFEIWTDHKNLEYFRTAQKLNRRQARWSLFLSRFNFTLHHKPGRTMGKPDALSRRADHGSGQADNSDITLLTPELFQVRALSAMNTVGEERSILRDIRRTLTTGELDEVVVKATSELKRDKTRKPTHSAEWSETADGLLLFRGKIYVPRGQDLRRRIVKQHHDSRIAGHPGRWKTLELVSRSYWWPQMSRYIGLYTKTCDLCCRTKILRHKPIGELHPTATPTERWSVISVDFVSELPRSRSGYDAILNVVDSVSKRRHFIPTFTTVTAEQTAELFFREVWRHHGLPDAVISDRGPQFVAAFTRELYRLLGIKLSTTTAYHPQSDGQTERVNQEMEQFLRSFVNEMQNDWEDLLPLAEFASNNHVHASTQQTPFMVDSGRNPRMGFEPKLHRSDIEPANDFRDRMSAGLEEAKAALTKAKSDYSEYYNRRRTPAPTFRPGDKVWLDASDIKTTRPSSKLAHRRLGPFTVDKQVGHGAYRLHLPRSYSQLHPVFPVVKLTPALADPIPGRRTPPPPPPTLLDGVAEYDVEAILNSRFRYNRMEYLVKWKGYDTGENTWEPHYNLRCPDLVKHFHRLNPAAPQRISALSFRSIPFRPRPATNPADKATCWRSALRGDAPSRGG